MVSNGPSLPALLWRRLDAAVMPGACIFCGTLLPADGPVVCRPCHRDLPQTPRMTIAAGLPVVAAYAYAFPLDAAIRALKFRRRLYYAPALAHLLTEALPCVRGDVDALLPVPLHWTRQTWRGFNQAEELCRPLARRLGAPLLGNVRRSRRTRPQPGLPPRARRRNLHNAFRVRGRIDARHVLIVDDVVTTGATCAQLAGTLRRAGVERVSVLALARAATPE